MNFLWFTWKDKKNPLSGGAEFINEAIAKRLAREGHEVVLLVGGFPGCQPEEIIDGYKIIRLGNRWTVYWKTYRYYCKNLKGWADLVIEEINTIPFLVQLYAKDKKRILFFHQLCRKIWFYEMFFPLNVIGYLLEPLYLYFMRKNSVITVSESTKKDLLRFGFDRRKVYIIPEAIEMFTVEEPTRVEKYSNPTLLSLGALRPMKRTIHQIEAFNIAKKSIPNLKLIIAGDGTGRYKQKVLRAIEKSPNKKDIRYVGRIDLDKKYELMQKSHVILVTSVKEGWGLVVTEAASQGTPALVYDVDGLRDSVRDGFSGLICKNNSPADMAAKIGKLLRNKENYEAIRYNAWIMSKEYTPERCFEGFMKAIGDLPLINMTH
jgi:glycosyltransferase involved in cell wall biosynthesis